MECNNVIEHLQYHKPDRLNILCGIPGMPLYYCEKCNDIEEAQLKYADWSYGMTIY